MRRNRVIFALPAGNSNFKAVASNPESICDKCFSYDMTDYSVL